MKYKANLLSEQRFGSGHYPSNGIKSPDGEVFVGVGPRPKEKPYSLYSKDGGITFERIENAGRATHLPFIQLRDGTYIAKASSSAVFRSLINYEQEKVPFILTVHRADSFEDI